jgi:hypothetical protein
MSKSLCGFGYREITLYSQQQWFPPQVSVSKTTLGMAVVVEILAGHFFVEGDVEAAGAVDDSSFMVVDGCAADEYREIGAVDWTQRNFVAVPEFVFEGLGWGRVRAAGDFGFGVWGDGLGDLREGGAG